MMTPILKQSGLPKCKLLFIDDDLSVLTSLRLLLGKKYETYSASTVEEGLRLFAEVQPEIVLLDLRLPDRSGIEALREIRKVSLTAPVLILTGYSTRSTAEQSLRLGATDYINKPFRSAELTRKIDRLALARSIREKSEPLEHSIKESVDTFCEFQEFQNASAAFLHDVASPLSTLMTGVDLLGLRLEEQDKWEEEDVRPLVEMMSQSVGYLRSLVEQWRSFSEIHTLIQGKGEVKRAIDLAVLQVTKPIHSANILLIIKHAPGRQYISGDGFAVARVLINLLKNAAEAVEPMTGRIQLTTTVEAETVEITISDNGPGIAAEMQQRIFQPRFSTKSTGKGLGLFISQKVTEALGGTISIRSPGLMGGADFVVSLPLVESLPASGT